MTIMLRDVLHVETLNEYKVPFAKWNGRSLGDVGLRMLQPGMEGILNYRVR